MKDRRETFRTIAHGRAEVSPIAIWLALALVLLILAGVAIVLGSIGMDAQPVAVTHTPCKATVQCFVNGAPSPLDKWRPIDVQLETK